MSFAIPGAFPPPTDKAARRAVAGHDGALLAELFSEPEINLPLLIRVSVVDQANVVWLDADQTSDTISRTTRAGRVVFSLRVRPGELPPGSYRVFLQVRSPSTPQEDRPVELKLPQFIIRDTAFAPADVSSYSPIYLRDERQDGRDGASAYLYIGYASSNAGAGFSLSPSDALTYVALRATDTEIDTPTAADFAGLWTLRAGAAGPTGPEGPTGPDGPAGATGADGADGATGPEGPAGATGPAGAAGPAGATGATGPAGAAGATGATGADGADGADALWNFTGAYSGGAPYAVGDVATYDGETWYRINSNGGNVGDTPAEGTFWTLIAAEGATGETGPEGPAGSEGAQGPEGPQGIAGADGDGTAYYGQLSRTTSGTVTSISEGVYKSTGLAGNLDTEVYGFERGTDQMSLKNVSGEPILCRFYASADIEAGNSKVLGIKLALDGVLIDETECRAPTGVGTTFAKLVTSWIIEVADGEEVALYVANHTTTGNLTVQRCRLIAATVGRQGETGATGNTGAAGAAGPNEVTTATDSAITGILKGAAGKVAQAVAGTDYVPTDDARLSDARTPTAHKASHATGGSDALTPGDIGAATSAQGSLAASAVQPGASFTAGAINASGGIDAVFSALTMGPYGTQPFFNVGVNSYYAFCSTSTNAYVGPDSALHPATGGVLLMTPNKSAYQNLSLKSLIATESVRPGSYTVATVPAAANHTCGMIYVTDETGGAVPAFSDGTNWRRVTDRAIIS